MFLTTLIILVQIFRGMSADCVIDNMSSENHWEKKLMDDVLACYHEYRPVQSNETHPLKIAVRFTLNSFNYYSESQTFSISVWMRLSWQDPRLTWDPKDYDGIKDILQTSVYIWVPIINHYNEIEEDFNQKFMYSTCHIKSSGKVYCIVPRIFESPCDSDLWNWPYDSQRCKVVLGVEQQGESHMQLTFEKRAITMIAAEYGSEWNIMDYQQFEDQNIERALTMLFTLERHADVLAAMLVSPCVLLSLLTILILFLDVRESTRRYMSCFSLLCHFYLLTEIGNNIPEHNKASPSILLYFRGSIVMTTLSIVLSFILHFLCKREKEAPLYLVIFKDYVFNSYGKYFVFPKWELGNDDKSRISNEWSSISNICNSVWLYINVIVYISLYCTFVPGYKEIVSTIPVKEYLYL